MTGRTRYRRATDRVEHANPAADPICRRLFSIEEAADFAEVAVQVIHRWIRMGDLELYDLGGGRVRIDEVELADLSRLRIPTSHAVEASRRARVPGS
jgi:hypothetical protein